MRDNTITGKPALLYWAAFAAIVVVAAWLRLYHLGGFDHLGNAIYSATARSMALSPYNFFFNAFDPGAVFIHDKPPFGMWIQSLAVMTFGFSGFSVTLPGALAGALSVLVLCLVASRHYGRRTALLAAAVFAAAPLSVLVSRNNSPDAIQTLLVLSSLYCLVRYAERENFVSLLLATVLAALAFNTKGFQMGPALVALIVYFLLSSNTRPGKLVIYLSTCGAVFCALCIAWPLAVDLVPTNARPVAMNADNNSALDMVFWYNGFGRLLSEFGFDPASFMTSEEGLIPIGVFYGGHTGPWRLLGEFPGPLVVFILPLAVAGSALLFAGAVRNAHRAASCFWLTWLFCGVVVFNYSRMGSPQYLESFAPALAVAAGVAMTAALSHKRLPALIGLGGIFGSALVGGIRFSQFGEVGNWILAACITAMALSLISFPVVLFRKSVLKSYLATAAIAGTLAVLFFLSWESVRKVPAEGLLPGIAFLKLDHSREVRFDGRDLSYWFFEGDLHQSAEGFEYLSEKLAESPGVVLTQSFSLAARMIARYGLPAVPLYSEMRSRVALPEKRLQELFDENQVRYVVATENAFELAYPLAHRFIETRCREITAEAGLKKGGLLRIYEVVNDDG